MICEPDLAFFVFQFVHFGEDHYGSIPGGVHLPDQLEYLVESPVTLGVNHTQNYCLLWSKQQGLSLKLNKANFVISRRIQF